MADDWEDWDDDPLQPAAPAATNGAAATKGQAVLARVNEPDASKFADEDAEEEAPPAWEKDIPKPQQVLRVQAHYWRRTPVLYSVSATCPATLAELAFGLRKALEFRTSCN